MDKVFDVNLRKKPKYPNDIDLYKLRNTVINIVSKYNLHKPLAIAMTGSRVWGLETEKSDIDIIAFGRYNYTADIFGIFEEKELEITLIPLKKVRNKIYSFSFETRWDIVTSLPLSEEDEAIVNFAKIKSIPTIGEINDLLSYIIYEISWCGVSPYSFEFRGTKIYSYPDRWRNSNLVNAYGVLFHALNLLAMAQYVMNRLPYPSPKWRFIHLDKLYRVSPTLLEFSNNYRKNVLEFENFFEKVSKIFIETINLLENSEFLKDSLTDYENYRKKLIFYSYL